MLTSYSNLICRKKRVGCFNLIVFLIPRGCLCPMFFVPWVGLQCVSVAFSCHTLLLIVNMKNIRIHHECEGRTEKSIPTIAVWHHEACRVMTNADPEGQIFLSYPHTNNGLFFLLTAVFIYLFVYLL